MILTLVDFHSRVRNVPSPSDKEKLQVVRGEVYSGLEDRLEELRREALRVIGDMSTVIFRIDHQGFDANLEDLKTGKWYRLVTEIKTLQEVASVIESLR